MKSLERLVSSATTMSLDPEVLAAGLKTMDELIGLNPTPHRPILPTLLPLLHTLLLSPPTPLSANTKKTLTSLLARLHTLSGKTSSGATFKGDLEGMMRETGWALDGLGEDVWVGGIGGGSGAGVGAGARGLGQRGMGASISASQPLMLGLSAPQVGGPGAGPGSGYKPTSNGGMTVVGDKSARLDLRLQGWVRCLDGWVEGIVGMLKYVLLPIF